MNIKIVKIGKPFSLRPDVLARVLNDSLRTEAIATRGDFQKTTTTWSNQPDFVIDPSGNFEVDVYTTNEVYGYLDGGTEPHKIAAKNAPTLAFPTAPPFVSKSKPNSLTARKGKQPTTGFTFPKVVNHPGFPARNFAKLIAKQAGKRLAREIRANLAAVKK